MDLACLRFCLVALATAALAACGARDDLGPWEGAPGGTETGSGAGGSGGTAATETATETATATGSTSETEGPCADPDKDGDGHLAIACGGGDCDDQDAGIHPGAPDDAGGQWTSSVVDATAGGFRSAALALDAEGQPRLAYVSNETKRLYWAERSGAGWQVEEVAIAWAGPTRSASATIDAAGVPHIMYSAGGLRRAAGGPGAWATEVVDDAVGTNYFANAVAAKEGALHVAYRQKSSLLYGRFDGAAWELVSFAPNGSAGGADVGIGVDAGSNVHISFESVIGGMFGESRLRYAVGSGGGFQVEDVEVLPAQSGGTFDSLAVRPDGTVHIAYRDGAQKALRLATGTFGSWARETVDGAGDAGLHASIAIDGAGAVHVCYRAAAAGELRHATNAGGAWAIEVVDAGVDTGLFSSIEIDERGYLHVGHITASEAEVRYSTNAPAADGVDQDCDGKDG